MKKLKTPAQRPRKAPSNQTGGTAWGKKMAAEISRMAQAADMKKLILLNFPYIIAFYMVEKAAWLYRHCNGDTVVDRLMVLFMNFGLAYKSVLPSFHPFDLMVGLVGAAALRAVIYFKGKNAKKYRQGEEYGSARWGNQKDIEPFIDPVFENNVILTQTERLMMSGRPKHPKYARNKNVIVIGGSGSGKTRFYVKPNLMQMPEKVSYVLTDPKGTIIIECGKMLSDAGYKDILQPGYTAKPVPFVEPEKDKDVPFPKKMEQGMVLPVVRAEKKQGFTSPPKVYTEDTLLSAMETAGNKEFEKDTEKKGLGTPATRAAILEKLVSSGYVQRKGKQIIPTEDGVAAIHNIPDYLKSASMTAEWENDLLRMERGEIKPHDFMQGIHGLLDKMLADLRQIPTVAAVPYYNKVSVGSCPVCGNPVHESKLSFCCADRSCKFALWKESRYLSNMRKTLDKKMAVDLLKKGRTHVKDFYSVKKDKTFAADLVMRVEDGRAQYSLEFPRTPMKTKT